MALMEAKHIHKRFGQQVVLEEINLTFEAGKINGIMGPNGAGKSTCFNVLTGRYTPDRGQILLDGAPIGGLAPHEIARRGVSRSFQLMNVFNDYTALENVMLAVPQVRSRGFNIFSDAACDELSLEKGRTVLQRVGLLDKQDELAKNLSYGNRRALEIAIALAAEPRILFLDEPTAGLGTDATAQLAQLIGRLKGSLAMVIIEHDMEFLFGLADRISVIHWGQVIASGTPDELRANKWVQRSTVGMKKAN